MSARSIAIRVAISALVTATSIKACSVLSGPSDEEPACARVARQVREHPETAADAAATYTECLDELRRVMPSFVPVG